MVDACNLPYEGPGDQHGHKCAMLLGHPGYDPVAHHCACKVPMRWRQPVRAVDMTVSGITYRVAVPIEEF